MATKNGAAKSGQDWTSVLSRIEEHAKLAKEGGEAAERGEFDMLRTMVAATHGSDVKPDTFWNEAGDIVSKDTEGRMNAGKRAALARAKIQPMSQGYIDTFASAMQTAVVSSAKHPTLLAWMDKTFKKDEKAPGLYFQMTAAALDPNEDTRGPDMKKWFKAAYAVCVKAKEMEALDHDTLVDAMKATKGPGRSDIAKIEALVRAMTLYVKGAPATKAKDAVAPIVTGKDWTAALAALELAAAPILKLNSKTATAVEKVPAAVVAAIKGSMTAAEARALLVSLGG